MWDRSITSAYQNFPLLQQLKRREQRNTSSFHVFYLKSFVISTLNLGNHLSSIHCYVHV